MKSHIEFFKALSDEIRLRIINILLNKELCVCEIVEALGIPQYRISRHLGILKRAGVIDDRREGAWMYYSISRNKPLLFDAVLSALDTYLKDPLLLDDQQRLDKRLSLRVNGRCIIGYQEEGCDKTK